MYCFIHTRVLIGAAFQNQTQGEQLETVGSIVNSQSINIPMSAITEVLGKNGALGRNDAGPEGTCAIIEPMLTVPIEKPLSHDGISKCGSSRSEIDHNVNGKGGNVPLNFLVPLQQIIFLKFSWLSIVEILVICL